MTTPTDNDPIRRLEERLARIEARLDRLVEVLDAAPPVIAMAADAADEWARQAQDRGLDLDASAHAAGRLAGQVAEPQVLDAVGRLAQRVQDLEPLVDLAATFEPTVALAGDAFDAWAAEQQARGVDLDARGRAALALLDRLTDPEIAGRLERLVELLPKLTPVAELASTFEPTTAMVFDMVDEHVRGMVERGVDPEQRFQQVVRLAERLTEPAFDAHLHELLDAAPSLMAATRTGELFGRAVDEVTASPPPGLGLFGLLRALSNPDVQRALGFFVGVAERVGSRLPTSTTPARS